MTEAKRKILDFNFESEGAHVALVDKAANLQEVLVMKSLDSQKDSQPSVDSQGEDVVKTEGTETEINKEVNTMTTEVNQETLEEQINKAAEAIVAKRLEEIEKAADAKVEAVSKELEVFKAREDAREKQEYLAKAEAFASYLGEDADKEAIAKSLAFIEKSEDAKAAAELLKSLKDALDKESSFEEIGKSATEDQPTTEEAKVEELQKSFEAEGMTSARAYTKAYEQVHGV